MKNNKRTYKFIVTYIILLFCIFLVATFFNKIFINDKLEETITYNVNNAENNKDIDVKEDISENLPWNLILVNKWNKLPQDFSLKTITLKNGHSIDERAYEDLQNMMDSARSEGLSPIICSSYRSNEYQIELYNNQIEDYISKGYSETDAKNETEKWLAIPGTSEHETGLALDIVSLEYQLLDENQENTPEQKWLLENSYKYGFILRYPKDKEHITGISYEPWHYRYVGKEAAKEIFEQKLSLEEYIEKINN